MMTREIESRILTSKDIPAHQLDLREGRREVSLVFLCGNAQDTSALYEILRAHLRSGELGLALSTERILK